MRLFHYTVANRLPVIVESEHIIPATAGVPAHETPIVWCSFAQDWEETANKLCIGLDGSVKHGNRDTTRAGGQGLARIEVPISCCPLDWKAYKASSGIRARDAKGLFNAAIAAGSRPSDWRGTFQPIPMAEWLVVEIDQGEGWQVWEGWPPASSQGESPQT